MSKQIAVAKQATGKAAPLRGTQSFVGVMAEVFKRPALTGLELGWRLAVWVPFLALAAVGLGSRGMAVQLHPETLSSLTVFKPVEAIAGLGAFLGGLAPLANRAAVGWVGALFVVWVAAWTLGRGAVMRRLAPGFVARPGTLLPLAVLRVTSMIAVIGLWFAGCRWAVVAMVLRPALAKQEPNLVLAFAVVVTATLVLFVLWCLVSWVLQLAPVLAMARNEGAEESMRGAVLAGPLRGKLIEINLVMGIVKIALIVLALVFSACPLPFETVETQAFLVNWWIGVGVLYVVASDYFHVVRAAAYVRLWQAYEIIPERISSRARAAS